LHVKYTLFIHAFEHSLRFFTLFSSQRKIKHLTMQKDDRVKNINICTVVLLSSHFNLLPREKTVKIHLISPYKSFKVLFLPIKIKEYILRMIHQKGMYLNHDFYFVVDKVVKKVRTRVTNTISL
jgi:hypothetical protein